MQTAAGSARSVKKTASSLNHKSLQAISWVLQLPFLLEKGLQEQEHHTPE
jgi:hypothetical protein